MKLLNEWIINNPNRDPRFDPEFNHMVEVFRDYTDHKIDLRMVTETGGLFYLPSKDLTPLATVTDREYFKIHKGTPPEYLYFAEPVQSRVTLNWGMPISFRLSPNGYSLRIIFAVIEYSVFDELFADLLHDFDRSVTIVRSDNTVLARTPVIASMIGTKIVSSPGEIHTGEIRVQGPLKNRRMVSYQKLGKQPVYIAVSENSGLVRIHWIQSMMAQALFAAVLLAGFLLISMRQSRLIAENHAIGLKLEAAAQYDNLTGLKSRRYFFERVGDEMQKSRRNGEKLTMLIADIDFFKSVNDSYGHPAGDAVLREIAEVIQASVRNTDHCGRLGGEEFGILLVDTGLEDALDTAERMRAAVSAISYNDWHAGLSVGVAEWKTNAEDMDFLMKRADAALYDAKNGGRNRVVAVRN
jgi:diguanylate cyclase (GGDEF)-like protein